MNRILEIGSIEAVVFANKKVGNISLQDYSNKLERSLRKTSANLAQISSAIKENGHVDRWTNSGVTNGHDDP